MHHVLISSSLGIIARIDRSIIRAGQILYHRCITAAKFSLTSANVRDAKSKICFLQDTKIRRLSCAHLLLDEPLYTQRTLLQIVLGELFCHVHRYHFTPCEVQLTRRDKIHSGGAMRKTQAQNEKYFRVFAVGMRCGHLISDRFNRRADAENFRKRLISSDPSADARIERVNVEGWAI
jgi:hypothetical protein